METERERMAKQFDALVAQLPKQKKKSAARALPWLVGLAMGLVAMVAMTTTVRDSDANQPAVQFPLAVCGNGVIEPSEDCELNQPDCPPDCVRRAESVDSTTPTQSGKRKE